MHPWTYFYLSSKTQKMVFVSCYSIGVAFVRNPNLWLIKMWSSRILMFIYILWSFVVIKTMLITWQRRWLDLTLSLFSSRQSLVACPHNAHTHERVHTHTHMYVKQRRRQRWSLFGLWRSKRGAFMHLRGNSERSPYPDFKNSFSPAIENLNQLWRLESLDALGYLRCPNLDFKNAFF